MPIRKAKRPDPEMNLGKPDETELHPRIEHALHLHEGHAVVKGTEIKVSDVLRALVRERVALPSPLRGGKLTEADIKACLEYSAEFMANLPALTAEITRLQTALAIYERRRK